MSLAYYARNAASAERMRRRIQREGFTMTGQKLWTEEERAIITKIGPDFDAIRKKLPHRTRIAIANQCRKMGLKQKHQHVWTAAEISKLRRLYPRASRQEILDAFPHSIWANIKQVANYHKISRARRPFKPTGNPPVDEMLVKLFKANLSFADLDKECRTKRYFSRGKWRSQKLNYNRLMKAIELLEGELAVRWREE